MKAVFKSNKTFSDVKDTNNRDPRPDEIVDMFKFPPNEWVQLRFVGPIFAYGKHWIESRSKEGKTIKFPKTCVSFDPQTEDHDSTKSCAYCEADDERIRFSKEYFTNAIIRSVQEDEPSKKGTPSKSEDKTGIKTKGSKTWTPARGVRLTSTLIRELKKIGALNRHKDKKTGEKKGFDLSNPKYGCDVSIMYDPDAKLAANAYSIQKGDHSPLTEEEQEYLLWDLSALMSPETPKEAKKEVERWSERMATIGGKKKKKGDDEDDDDDDDDEDTPKSKKGKGKPDKNAKGKKHSKDDDEDEEDDLDEDDDLDDEDEDTPKSKKSKAKPSKKSKKSDDDDDEDDEDDDEDEDDEDDEDDTPKSKKAKAKPSKKSKKSDDDDDDEDEDDEDDDDEDEDVPKSKASKAKGKPSKKPSKKDDDDDEDEDDDDEDDDDDDLDDVPKKKAKGKPAKKAKKQANKGKKSKKSDDDDEDDEDDEDEDD